MKIYFGASISLDRGMLPSYRKIVGALNKQGHEVLSEYVVDPKLVVGAGLTPEKLFERETLTIDKADVMIAEVTTPSWGTAFLMEHALEKGKPVLALYYKEAEKPLPMMIEGHPDLYVEHYDEDNIGTVIRHNLKHFGEERKRTGKLIVIDGADGSGKATQTQMLLELLSKLKKKHKYIDFPRYYTSFHGKVVGRYLAGEFGSNKDANPYLASLSYALDRLTARDEMVEWLKEGNVVVANRYTTSSFAFQGARLEGREREEYIKWLYDMEYKEHKLPKEDLVIFLYVPIVVSQKLLKKKQAAESRRYTKGKKKDIHEADVEYQKKVLDLYIQLSKRFKHWEIVNCVDDKGKLLSKEKIHEKVVQVLKEKEIV